MASEHTPKTVSVRPGVGMLALFPSMNYKPWYAIGEFVDNSIQSWSTNKRVLQRLDRSFVLRIDVQLDHERGRIVVRDNAAGISGRDVQRAFKPAEPPADRTGLSQFGIGMKSASCWYARNFTVVSDALGENVRRTVKFDVPKLVASGDDVVPIRETVAPPGRHGTAITLSNLYHPIPTGRTLGKLRSYLASIYRHFLRVGDVEMIVGDELLRYKDPALLVAPRWDTPKATPREWRKDVAVKLPSGRIISGWAALRAKGNTAEAGLALLYRGKVVMGAGAMAGSSDDTYRPAVVFGRGNTFMSQRLFGELDVSELRVTYSKDSIIWGGEEEIFLERLRKQLDAGHLPLLKMAQEYRSTERTRVAADVVKSAVKATAAAVAVTLNEVLERSGSAYSSGPSDEEYAKVIGKSGSAPVQAEVRTPGLRKFEGFRLQVVDEPFESRWLRVVGENGRTTVAVNRAHKFMQSFANVPGSDIEPVLRLAAALAIAEVRGRASGVAQPAFVREQLNDLLEGPLSTKITED
jgi:Histidine kinase-, DNA gyrase B-, and HSP90-like ATPase